MCVGVCVCVRAKSVLYVHVLSVRACIVCARAWVRMLGTGERPGTCEPSVCCMCMLCETVHTFGSRTKLGSLARESLASKCFGVSFSFNASSVHKKVCVSSSTIEAVFARTAWRAAQVSFVSWEN